MKLSRFIWLIFFFSHYLRAQNYKEQLQHLSGLPVSVEKFYQLAKIYDETGNNRQAIYYYEKALALDTANVKIKSKLAGVYKRYGLLHKTIALQENIIKNDSLNYLEQYRLAVNCAQTKQIDKALSLLEKLQKVDPKNPNYPYRIGLYETDLNKKLDAYLRAYRLDSLHKKTLYGLIKNYKIIKFIDSAEYYLHKALKAYPYDTKFLRQKVIADYRHKQYDSMLVHLGILDSLRYDAAFVRKNTGLAYLMLDELDKSERALKEAIKIDRNDPFNYYYLGLLYEKKNDWFNAKQYFNLAVLYKKPSLDKEYFELGNIAKKERKLKKAIDYYKKAFENNPKNKEALLQLAMMSEVYYKSPDIAIKHYKKYLAWFENDNKEQTVFVKEKLKELKQKAFMNR